MTVAACPLPAVLTQKAATAKLSNIAQTRPGLSPAAQERMAAHQMGVDLPTFRSAVEGREPTQAVASSYPDEDRGNTTTKRSRAAAREREVADGVDHTKELKKTLTDTTARRATTERAVERAAATKDPTTVKGYRQMFNKVDTDEWGGGDISISHELPDGRRVWLYGDTWSAKNGFVHSTALVQKNGVLTPSNNGRQILPNGGKDPSDPSREIIYWFDGVKQGPTKDTIIVTAMEMSIGTAGPWDFRRTSDTQSRQAIIKIKPNGDMVFKGWKSYVATPTEGNPHLANDFKDHGGGHVSYGTVTHDIKLKNGQYLTTRSHNHTDPLENHVGPDGFQWWDYRPTLGSTKKKP